MSFTNFFAVLSIIIIICVIVGIAAVAIVFSVKRLSWTNKMFAYLKTKYLTTYISRLRSALNTDELLSDS